MEIYDYDSVTSEYLGSRPASPDPLEPGRFLIPACATVIPPLKVGEKEVAVWDGEKWVVTADYRGEIFYNKQTRQAVVVINIGEIPAGVTSLKPEGSVVWNDITEVWEAVESKLSEEINAVQIQLRSYIYSKYGAGTQSTMTAVYLEPTTVLKDKDRILAVWNWIKSVLFYYYNLKKQLETGTKLSDLKVDFTQFNETDPKVTLESFI